MVRSLRLIPIVLLLVACSNNDAELLSLRAEVDRLFQQVEEVTGVAERFEGLAAQAQEELVKTKACMNALRAGMNGALINFQYVRSNNMLGGAVVPFSATRCADVIGDKQLRSLKARFASTQQVVDQVSSERMRSLIPPVPNPRPAGVTAICNDGTYSYSQNASGTCSWHGVFGSGLTTQTEGCGYAASWAVR